MLALVAAAQDTKDSSTAPPRGLLPAPASLVEGKKLVDQCLKRLFAGTAVRPPRPEDTGTRPAHTFYAVARVAVRLGNTRRPDIAASPADHNRAAPAT